MHRCFLLCSVALGLFGAGCFTFICLGERGDECLSVSADTCSLRDPTDCVDPRDPTDCVDPCHCMWVGRGSRALPEEHASALVRCAPHDNREEAREIPVLTSALGFVSLCALHLGFSILMTYLVLRLFPCDNDAPAVIDRER